MLRRGRTINDKLKISLKIAALIIAIIVVLIPLFVSVERLEASRELCDNECEELNLTRKEINYVGGRGHLGYEVESCDCKIPNYIRVKVKK